MMMMIFGLYFVKIPWLFSTTLLEIGFTRADITLPMKQNPIQSLQLLFFASRFLVNFLPANRQCSCCSSDFILMIRLLVQWCLDCTILSYGGKSGCCLRVQMTVDAVAMAAEQEVSLSHGLSPVTPRYKSVACTCDLLWLLAFACTSPGDVWHHCSEVTVLWLEYNFGLLDLSIPPRPPPVTFIKKRQHISGQPLIKLLELNYFLRKECPQPSLGVFIISTLIILTATR